MVPKVSIRFDPRFDLETNWKFVEEVVRECKSYGVITTPLTVFDKTNNRIIGWFMEGWKPLPPKFIYNAEELKHMYVLDYCI